MIPAVPSLESLARGTILKAGLGTSEVIACFDFETYSPAGFIWDEQLNKFIPPHGADRKGLESVGTVVYAEHPDAEVLSLAYDLRDGQGVRLWTPDNYKPPTDLFTYINEENLLEAWNISFEYWVWNNICIPKYNFPPLRFNQLRCAMAKSRAYSLPGSLEETCRILNTKNKKNSDGKRLLKKFSIPRDPTKNNAHTRVWPNCITEDEDTRALYEYNKQDVLAEFECSTLIPDLIPQELEFWQYDQLINIRGVQVDIENINNCIEIIEQAYTKYNTELKLITNGEVNTASEIGRLTNWVNSQNVQTSDLTANSVESLLRNPALPPQVKHALEIRELLGSAAVKKLYAMKNQASKYGRLHNLFIYHSARTGRAAGAGPQPQNLPNSGPDIKLCLTCNKYSHNTINGCAWCCADQGLTVNKEWNIEAVNTALNIIKTRSLECVEYYFKDALASVSGCLRSLFIAKPQHDLICSDFSAIEAVVLAALAGEEWRLEVFRTHGRIYEMSASKITGVPFEEFIEHKNRTGQHHPLRKTVGKVAELASGYQGWVTAWRQFGADKFFNEEQIKQAVLAWRKASPAIVEFWGGQFKNKQSNLYGIEGAAINAIMHRGNEYTVNGITFIVQGNALYCQLLSGRYLTYHNPKLLPSDFRAGLSISYETWNTNPKNGAMGWVRLNTYGGRLVENIVQATARDILAHAIVNLEKSGYPVVLHIHDEIVSEISENFGSIEEFEKIMSTMPNWAASWPINAKGGWRGKRYRKD